MSYPVALEVDYVAKRSRLTTFFRILLVIPLEIVALVYGIGALLAVVAAWFVLLFTGRWPAGLYEFVGGVLRFTMRLHAYTFLAPDDSYPVRVRVAPPQASYSRLKVLLRILYVIPAYIIAYVLTIFSELIAIVAWFVIVIIGKQPAGLQNALVFCLKYVTGASALMFLLTETYPPFDS